MTKQLLLYVMSVGMLLSAPTALAAQTREAERQTTVQGTVEAVDHTNRTVTIRLNNSSKVVTLDVPKEAMRFEEVKVGDPITASYYEWVSIRLKPAGEKPVDRTIEPTTVGNPGSLPGATRIRQREATVTITAWDPATHVVSFTGPGGTAYSRSLVDTTDPNILKGIKVGDRVDVTRTEAVTVSKSQSVAVAAQPDDLRHRLTFSVLFGPDNQFSGHMIKQATGQTTGGAPINLNETTYDEVYGRIGMFKLGVGYRTVGDRDADRHRRHAAGRAQCPFHRVPILGVRGRPAVVLRPYALHALRGLPRGHQPQPGPPWHVRGRACQCHARARSAGRQVLRKVVGVQPGADRWNTDRRRSIRGDGRDPAPFHGRSVRRGLADRRRPAGYQQRELALVDPVSDRRAHPVLRPPHPG